MVTRPFPRERVGSGHETTGSGHAHEAISPTPSLAEAADRVEFLLLPARAVVDLSACECETS